MHPTTPAVFHGQAVTLIHYQGRRWLTAEQIGLCLGYAHDKARISISNLYNRHADEFTPEDTGVIKLMTNPQGGNPTTRIFSHTGCIKLGFFAATAKAKDFRTWASRELATRQERHASLADIMGPDGTVSPAFMGGKATAILQATRLFQATRTTHHTLGMRQSYLMAAHAAQEAYGVDLLAIWKLDPTTLPDNPQKQTPRGKLDKLARYLSAAKRLPVPKQSRNAQQIAELLSNGYVPRQILLKSMHVSADEFNRLITEAKEAGIVRELDGIEVNYGGTIYVLAKGDQQ